MLEVEAATEAATEMEVVMVWVEMKVAARMEGVVPEAMAVRSVASAETTAVEEGRAVTTAVEMVPCTV